MKVNVKKLWVRIIVCIIVASIGLISVNAEGLTTANEILIFESGNSTDQSENIYSEDESSTEPPEIEDESHTEPPEIEDGAENELPIKQVFIYDGYHYTLENGEATIVKKSSNFAQDTVPSEINGYPVVAIGEGAYYGALFENLLTIPESVKVIEKNAFEKAQIKGGICFFKHLEKIEEDAFKDATIESVQFFGLKSKFNNISIGAGNESLLNADFNDKFAISWMMFKAALGEGFSGFAELPAYILFSLGSPLLLLIPPLGLIGFAGIFGPAAVVANTISNSLYYFIAAIIALFV